MSDAQPKSKEEKKIESPGEAKPGKKDIVGVLILFVALINALGLGAMGMYVKKLLLQYNNLTKVVLEMGKEEGKTADNSSDSTNSESQNKIDSKKELSILIPLDPFLVNVRSEEGVRFLQVQIELEVTDTDAQDETTSKRAAIRDAIIMELSNQNMKNFKRPQALEDLRTALLKSVNGVMTTHQVKDLYFTQFHFN